MKKEYWDVSNGQLIEKTGKEIDHWIKILRGFNAKRKKSKDVVTYLKDEHNVPRYWARTLTTLFLKSV